MRDPGTVSAPVSVRTPRHSVVAPSRSPQTMMAAQNRIGPQADSTQSPPQDASPRFPLPKLRLEVRDLTHRGANTFLSSVHAGKALAISVQSVLSLLYEFPGSKTTTPPPTRSVTLVLRPMDGIAYTTGLELDSDHKEIHISLDYILGIDASRSSHEILGVLTHEMVHCFQYNAFGTCPGGLIEGVADWVRLHSGLSPPHWQRKAGEKWDAGYEHTGFFLDYLETRFSGGLVRRLNEKLRIEKYEEKRFWVGLCGRPIEQLWSDYKEVVEKERRDADECVIVEKGRAAASERPTTPMVL